MAGIGVTFGYRFDMQYRCISDTLTGKAQMNTKAAGEMLVRQHLETLQASMIVVTLVKSCLKLIDCLTGVLWRWLDLYRQEEPVLEGCTTVGSRLNKN